jgi:hypothetical protein
MRNAYIVGTEIDRFWPKVDKTVDCWLWKAAIRSDGKSAGYGVFRATDRTVKAHKWLWELLNGKVPSGYELDHTCHSDSTCVGGPTCLHRRCVNPDHLELVTHGENARRSAPGARIWRTAITHCPQGHEYSGANLYLAKRGKSLYRACLLCRRRRSAAWRKKQCA